jgi:hypothetical protein
MHGRLRINIAYHHAAFILVNEIARYLSGDDFAEQTIVF